MYDQGIGKGAHIYSRENFCFSFGGNDKDVFRGKWRFIEHKTQALMDSFKIVSIKLVALSVQEATFSVMVFLCDNCAQIKCCKHLSWLCVCLHGNFYLLHVASSRGGPEYPVGRLSANSQQAPPFSHYIISFISMPSIYIRLPITFFWCAFITMHWL